jgi:hypothetical protein
MRLFKCQACGNVVHFENTLCVSCGATLGYIPDRFAMSTLTLAGDVWTAAADPTRAFRSCANAQIGACNWLTPASEHSGLCRACRHNRMLPDLSVEENVAAWRKVELAKRYLFYSLTRLRLPLPLKRDNEAEGLAFDFLSGAATGGAKVMTGHDNGLITLDIAEADDAEREWRRTAMSEPYRTLLGHFRHEIGHFYWDRLVRDGGRLDAFRAMFGDERADYDAALQRHYQSGPAADWPTRFISAYASTHPWEDFAETWAHYLHMIDALETAQSYGLSLSPAPARSEALETQVDFDPYQSVAFAQIVPAFVAITVAVNSLNRSLGQPDIYPFVFSAAVIDKLGFVHDLVHAHRQAAPAH